MSAPRNTAPQQAERLERYGISIGRSIAGVLFLAAIGGVAWIYMGMVKLDRWPIQWMELDGAFERVSAEQVRKTVGPMAEGSFFTLDPVAIADATRELPWVNQVVVEKRWPDTVHLYLTEYVPVAHWNEGQLIATNGDTFTVPGADGIQGLPWLEGPPDAVEAVIETWLQFNDILIPAGQEITRIRLDRRGAWTLQLAGGTKVEIGREDAVARLERMVQGWTPLRRLKGVNPLGVDLRYANGFAVLWPEPPPGGVPVDGPGSGSSPAPAPGDPVIEEVDGGVTVAVSPVEERPQDRPVAGQRAGEALAQQSGR